jgi:hypothetical protein
LPESVVKFAVASGMTKQPPWLSSVGWSRPSMVTNPVVAPGVMISILFRLAAETSMVR